MVYTKCGRGGGGGGGGGGDVGHSLIGLYGYRIGTLQESYMKYLPLYGCVPLNKVTWFSRFESFNDTQ